MINYLSQYFIPQIVKDSNYGKRDRRFCRSAVPFVVAKQTATYGGVIMGNKEIPPDIQEALKIWYRNATILRFIQVFIGILAIILTITVASKVVGTEPKILGIEPSSWISWGAAISTGLLASLNVGGKANNMWNGWRKLNEAKMRYANQSDFGPDKL